MGHYDSAIEQALANFWGSRDAQAARQRASGVVDAGTRGAVTGGAHLNAVTDLITASMVGALPQNVSVHTGGGGRGGGGTTIPGYFRPTKTWDIVIRQAGHIVGVIELKSQVGSFGNNANNRAEEALGNATDLQAAQRHGLIPDNVFVGYAFVIEQSPRSDAPSNLGSQGGSAVDQAFHRASYIDRVGLLCERVVEDGLYTAAWCVATSAPPSFDWMEPYPVTTGFERFAETLRAHLVRLA